MIDGPTVRSVCSIGGSLSTERAGEQHTQIAGKNGRDRERKSGSTLYIDWHLVNRNRSRARRISGKIRKERTTQGRNSRGKLGFAFVDVALPCIQIHIVVYKLSWSMPNTVNTTNELGNSSRTETKPLNHWPNVYLPFGRSSCAYARVQGVCVCVCTRSVRSFHEKYLRCFVLIL